jgi:hypothetical protein
VTKILRAGRVGAHAGASGRFPPISLRSTTICVAMPAWSVLTQHSVVAPHAVVARESMMVWRTHGSCAACRSHVGRRQLMENDGLAASSAWLVQPGLLFLAAAPTSQSPWPQTTWPGWLSRLASRHHTVLAAVATVVAAASVIGQSEGDGRGLSVRVIYSTPSPRPAVVKSGFVFTVPGAPCCFYFLPPKAGLRHPARRTHTSPTSPRRRALIEAQKPKPRRTWCR